MGRRSIRRRPKHSRSQSLWIAKRRHFVDSPCYCMAQHQFGGVASIISYVMVKGLAYAFNVCHTTATVQIVQNSFRCRVKVKTLRHFFRKNTLTASEATISITRGSISRYDLWFTSQENRRSRRRVCLRDLTRSDARPSFRYANRITVPIRLNNKVAFQAVDAS